MLSRLTCGVIYTDSFENHLLLLHAEQAEDYPQQILTLEYVRCATGSKKGKAWWQITWNPLHVVPEHRRYRIGTLLVHIPKPTQHGLRDRCLDYRDGRVVVIP